MAQNRNSSGGSRKPASPRKASNTGTRKKPAQRKRTTKKKTNQNNSNIYIPAAILAAVLIMVGTLFFVSKFKITPEKAAKAKIKAAQQVDVKNKPEKVIEKKPAEDPEIKRKKLLNDAADKAETITAESFSAAGILDSEKKGYLKTENELKIALSVNNKKKTSFYEAITKAFEYSGFKVSTDKGITAEKDGYTTEILFLPYVSNVTKKWKKAKISVVIDDCGYSVPLAKRLAAIDYPLTFAIIPHLPHVKETAEIARATGKPVFLHQPMQPLSYPKTDPGKGAILVGMPRKLIEVTLKSNMENIGKIDGFNNHMGSAATENRSAMEDTLEYMKRYTNVFLDSHTSRKTVAYDVCKEKGLKCGLNTTYLDNKADEDYISSQLLKCVERAEKSGECIIIGHLRPNTINVLERDLEKLETEGLKILSILDMVK